MCGTHGLHNTSPPPNPPSAPDAHGGCSDAAEHPRVQPDSRKPASVPAARRTRPLGTDSDAAAATGVLSLRTVRLVRLSGALSARVASWSWRPTYDRWRGGKSVSPFQRKMLAVMLARLRDPSVPFEECAKARPLPRREGIRS
jgi:hypothetical protein